MGYLRFLLVGLVFINAQLWAKDAKASSICKKVSSTSTRDTLLPPIVPSPEELELLRLVNEARRSPLWPNNNLWTAARFHSQEMVENNYFSHDSKDANGHTYETFPERIARFGYSSQHIAEDIACASSVSEAFAAWKKSAPHWQNIINPNFTEIGVGIAWGGPCGGMFTLDFGARSLYFDLSISNLSYDTSGVLKAMVYNFGKTHTYPVWVRFYKGDPIKGEVIGEELIPPILPTDWIDSVSIKYLPQEQEEIYAVVDPDSIFPDENRENNITHIEVLPRPGIAQTPISQKVKVTNCPNPFSKYTKFFYEIPHPTEVSLIIYDITGKLVRTLIAGYLSPGCYSVRWDGTDEYGRALGSGVYFWRLEAGGYVIGGKTVMKP